MSLLHVLTLAVSLSLVLVPKENNQNCSGDGPVKKTSLCLWDTLFTNIAQENLDALVPSGLGMVNRLGVNNAKVAQMFLVVPLLPYICNKNPLQITLF
jgi:hypothetical protein